MIVYLLHKQDMKTGGLYSNETKYSKDLFVEMTRCEKKRMITVHNLAEVVLRVLISERVQKNRFAKAERFNHDFKMSFNIHHQEYFSLFPLRQFPAELLCHGDDWEIWLRFVPQSLRLNHRFSDLVFERFQLPILL